MTATARHCPARQNDIPVQRYDLEIVPVLFRYDVRVVNGIANERVPQKVAHDVIIIVVVAYKLGRKPHRAAFGKGALNFPRVGFRAHTRYG